ncbi:MAG: hypothetical protein SGJ04_07495 [Bacteroidota bacterium]|nr:hypothetical protein [Bacteroidota bacterium]
MRLKPKEQPESYKTQCIISIGLSILVVLLSALYWFWPFIAYSVLCVGLAISSLLNANKVEPSFLSKKYEESQNAAQSAKFQSRIVIILSTLCIFLFFGLYLFFSLISKSR